MAMSYNEEKKPKFLFHFLKTLIKFGMSGAVSAFITISLLFLLTEILEIWYLFSSIIAFGIGIIVNFLLQKFWAFKGEQKKSSQHQFILFIIINIINILLNTGGMFLLVEKFGIYYLLAQIIMAILLAANSFYFYKFLIFSKQENIINDE